MVVTRLSAAGSPVLQASIEQATESLTSGHSLVPPLRGCPLFPTSLLEGLAVAEESNPLSPVLDRSAAQLERGARQQIQVALKMLEPVLLLVMAAIVLFIVLALQLPLLELGTGSVEL